MRTLIILLLLCSIANAEDRRYWRVKITNPAAGELIGWPKNSCGTAVADNVWRIVHKLPYLEIVDDTFSARVDEPKPVPAHRSVLGDSYVGFYDISETRTIVFVVRHKDAKDRRVPVEVSVIVRDAADRTKACRETWLGAGVRI